MVSPAADDCLKAIYHHTEWQDRAITPKRLAAELALAPSSVTEMVQKLAALGLVEYQPYRPIVLTERGRLRAASTIRRHRLIETWLVREFGYTWDEVHDEAEVLEHSISDRLLERIDERLGRPRFDPHGDAIPDADGGVTREPFVLLRDASPGHTARVLRVSDRDAELLRSIEDSGLRVGAVVTVAEAPLVLAPADADQAGVRITLPTGADAAVWLSRAP